MGVFFRNRARDGLSAMAEVVLPENDFGAPDWRQTSIVSRTFEYIAELPPRSRMMLMVLFAGIELATPLLLFRFSRFSRLSKARRLRAIERWSASSFFGFSVLGDSIKAVLVMMYLSHPLVSEHIGEYKVCSQPEDPLQLPIRPDALVAGRRDSDDDAPAESGTVKLPGASESSEVA